MDSLRSGDDDSVADPIHRAYLLLEAMTTTSFRPLLFIGALLLALLPALRAADRVPSIQQRAPQTAPVAPKKQNFFSRLFAGKTRPPDSDERKRAAPAAPPRRQMPQLSASLRPTARSDDTTRSTIDQPLPLTAARMVVPPVPSVPSTPPALEPVPSSSNPVVASPMTAASVAPLPGGRHASLAAPTPVAAPLFAHPVPGKSGCVYPPGVERIPANIVDVTGLPPGAMARDPVTNIVFVVP